MIELIVIVLLCCNGDGSKKGVINGLCIAGLILSVLLGIFWTPYAYIDTLIYVIFMLIGNAQGGSKQWNKLNIQKSNY